MTVQRTPLLLTPDDRAANPYLEVPFEVPVGTSSIEIRLDVDDATGAVVDLGCRDDGGWRGWSGGARRRVVISETEATWGYTPGPLPAGTWAVVLGLHEIPGEVAVEVTVTIPGGAVEPDPPAPPAVQRVRRRDVSGWPTPGGRRWLAADFHAHTLHSDGELSVRELAALAVAEGLDALAVTDHNTVSHHAELAAVSAEYGITLLPGQEVTTGRGHMNAFGRIPWVDFREHPDSWFRHVREHGGFASINHPVAEDCAWQWETSELPTHAELFHVGWLLERISVAPWAWWVQTPIRHALGGSDFHNLASGARPGLPVTWFAAADDGEAGVLDAAAAGWTSMSATMDAPVLIPDGEDAYAIDADGTIAHDGEGRRRAIHGDRVRLTGMTGGIRLETPKREIIAVLVGR